MEFKILLPAALFYIAYIAAGGAMFHLLEYESELNEISKVEEDFNTWLDEHSECVTAEEFRSLILEVLNEPDGSEAYVHNITEGANDWDFASSILVAVTVVTTIGYGHLSPETLEGQIFCVIYAVFGIPLNLLVLGGMGAKLADLIKRCRSKKMQERIRFHVIIRAVIITLAGVTIFLVLPSLAFYFVEEWTYWESWYYSFVTLSTIGFGDLVPGQNSDVYYRWWYRILVATWINLGLAWLATLIGTVSEAIHNEISRIAKKKEIEEVPEVPRSFILTVESRKEFLELCDFGPRFLTPPHRVSAVDLSSTRNDIDVDVDTTDTDQIILDFNRVAGIDNIDADDADIDSTV